MTKLYKVQSDKLYKVCLEIFKNEGICEDHADMVCSALIEAELRGTSSHGVIRVENYIKRLRAGGTKANTECRIVHETPMSLVLDGDNGLGFVVATQASRLIRKKAEQSGMAFGVAKESNHFGATSRWAFEMSGGDMIGFAGSNVHNIIAAIGAKKPAIGNNPFAIVFPADKHESICLDMACSTVAWGKAIEYRHKNIPVPDGWFVDANGENTSDPFQARYCTPFGAHKGFGIAVAVELLCSVLAGGAFGVELGNQYDVLDKPNRLSHFFGAIKISAFRDLSAFKSDVDRFIDQLKSTEKKAGVDEIFYPGEPEARCKANNTEKIILLEESAVRELENYAREVGVSPELITCLKAGTSM